MTTAMWIAVILAALSFLKLGVKFFRLPYISSRQHPIELKGYLNTSYIWTTAFLGLLLLFIGVSESSSMSTRVVLFLWLVVSLSDPIIEFIHYRWAWKYRKSLLNQQDKQVSIK